MGGNASGELLVTEKETVMLLRDEGYDVFWWIMQCSKKMRNPGKIVYRM